MKKAILFLTTFTISGFLYAGGRVGWAPESTAGAPIDPDYGGFSYSTSVFSVSGATIPGPVDVLGVYFTSGAVTSFVSIVDATSSVSGMQGTNITAMNIYNLGNSTAATNPNATGIGWSPVVGSGGSIHIRGNLIWFPNVGTFNSITLLYNREY